ncbi:hypothetical protein M0802_015114 [Mischocyttarus mexicanus]|nr:hypothetical protein M0802_015114 [Mischocyttarus mexicanus]
MLQWYLAYGGWSLSSTKANDVRSKPTIQLIQDKSTTVRVYFSNIIEKTCQGFLSKKLSQGKLKDKTRLIQDKSTTVRVYYSKNVKRLRKGFLSEKLSKSIERSREGFLSEKIRFSQQKVMVKSKQNIRQGG